MGEKDLRWPSAASLLGSAPVRGRVAVALVGVSTSTTSVSPRSSTSTPQAVRAALGRYSTWSYADHLDLGERVVLLDYGDVEDPDGDGGSARVAAALRSIDPSVELTLVLGGDNAATWHALRAFDLGDYGLVTLDAHLDVREGRSNGSPVRQLLQEGLDPRHVAQVGVSDFANSPAYATFAHDQGMTAISRDDVRRVGIVDAAAAALGVAAGKDRRRIYVDVDLDVADRSVVPACPAAVPGGLSADELRRFVFEVASSPLVTTIDFTEIDVEQDGSDQRTVRLAALLVLEALRGVLRRTL